MFKRPNALETPTTTLLSSTTNATTLAKKTKTGSRQETFAKQLVAIWQAFTPQETWTICHKLLPTSVADGG